MVYVTSIQQNSYKKFFLLFGVSSNCFFDIPILYLVEKIPRIIFVNKNVINNRVGLSFAPVNVKGNPNGDFLKKGSS